MSDKRIKAYADAMTEHAKKSARSTSAPINEGLFGKKRNYDGAERWEDAKEHARDVDNKHSKNFRGFVTKSAVGKMATGAMAAGMGGAMHVASGHLPDGKMMMAAGAAYAGAGAVQKAAQLIKGYRKSRAGQHVSRISSPNAMREAFDMDNQFEKELFETLEMGATDEEIIAHIETLDEAFGKMLKRAWKHSAATDFEKNAQRDTQKRVGQAVAIPLSLAGIAAGGYIGAKLGGAEHIPTGALAGGLAGHGLGYAAGVVGTRLVQGAGNLAKRIGRTAMRYRQMREDFEAVDEFEKFVVEMIEADFSETEILNILEKDIQEKATSN